MAKKRKKNETGINEEAANRAVFFIEKYLRHTKGRWAGVPFTLMPWQRDEIIRPLFGRLRQDGLRQYRTCYVEIPRKNGKSTLAAAIALKLLLADSEPGAEIYSAAADREQASIVFNEAAQMVRMSPVLSKRCKIIDSQKRIVVPKTGSFYRAISADAPRKHGFNAHGIIFDEVHAQPNRELWDVLTTSTGARAQPLVFAITTAGYDRNSICWELHDYAVKVRDGIIEDPTFLPVIYAADEDDDWKSEKVWAKCNPGLGEYRDIQEMRDMCKRAQAIPALENTFRRLYLNQWTSQESRWMQMDAWDATAGLVVEEKLHGRECYAGLDLSSTTDISALMLLFPMDNGELHVLSRFYIPEENIAERERRDRVPYRQWVREGLIKTTPGNVIDYAFIRQDINRLGALYNIKEIAHDPWNATQLALELAGDGFTMVPIRQGFSSMSAPTKDLMNLVLAKRLKHNGNKVLRWMADNVAVEQDAAGNIKPSKRKSTQRIDGIVALIMAIDRWSRNTAAAASVYEERGVLEV